MAAERNTRTLRELKARMEMLISYYRELGEEGNGFVEELEVRLRGVSDALHQDTSSLPC